MTDFETKDSGARQQWSSGMQRDTEEGKARFDLMIPEGVPYEEQLLTRFALLLSRGAVKYDARNWEKAAGEEEIARAKSSAFRHFMQWLTGETDEDHAAAVIFNLLVVETTRSKLAKQEETVISSWQTFAPVTLTMTNVPAATIALATGFPVEELNDVASNVLEEDEVEVPGPLRAEDLLDSQKVDGVQRSFGEIRTEDLRM